jgi:AcrR family transcriptional regulator
MHARHVRRHATKAHKRKEPTQARAAATVDAILEASARVFRARGLAKASVNGIARLAGVSVGSLYQYFPSKDALLVALAERHTDRALTLLEDTLGTVEDAPLPDAVRAVVVQMVGTHVDPLHQVLARGLDELGPATSVQEAIDARAIAAVERFLRRRAADVRCDALELAALLLVRAIDLLTHAAIERHPETLTDGRLVDELTALSLGYLTVSRRSGATVL